MTDELIETECPHCKKDITIEFVNTKNDIVCSGFGIYKGKIKDQEKRRSEQEKYERSSNAKKND